MRKINFDIKRKINNKKKKNMFEVKKSSRPINKKKKTNDKKLFDRASLPFSVITVPGVTTLMTSRLTMPLTALGSSSCSQIATLYPFFTSVSM